MLWLVLFYTSEFFKLFLNRVHSQRYILHYDLVYTSGKHTLSWVLQNTVYSYLVWCILMFFTLLCLLIFLFLSTLISEFAKESQSRVWNHCYGDSSSYSITQNYSLTKLNVFSNFLLDPPASSCHPSTHTPLVGVNQRPAQVELCSNTLCKGVFIVSTWRSSLDSSCSLRCHWGYDVEYSSICKILLPYNLKYSKFQKTPDCKGVREKIVDLCM